jgi:hypothetical protein
MTHTFELDYLLDLIRDAKTPAPATGHEKPAAVTPGMPAPKPPVAPVPKSIQNMKKPLGASQQQIGQEPEQIPPQ